MTLETIADARTKTANVARRLLGQAEVMPRGTSRLIEAATQWKSAECFDCGERFTSQVETLNHSLDFGHEVLHLCVARLVN